MNIEKQTLYNTEYLQELVRNAEKMTAAFGASRTRGGLYFSLRKAAKVVLRFEAASIDGSGRLFLDGALVGVVDKREAEIALKLEAGEHLFEFVSDTGSEHGDFSLTAQGICAEVGRQYLERVGGYSNDTQTVVYLKEGDETVVKNLYENGALTATAQNNYHYDEAHLYDRVNSAYTNTRRYVYSTTKDRFYVYTGKSNYLNQTAFRSVAICDARTLETGADYLVAYVTANGELHFLKTTDNARYNSNCYSETFTGYRRVLSAQRGSIFLAENKDRFWTALYFHAQGQKTLTFPQNVVFHYDAIPLGRNRRVAPNATIDETDGTPVFYFKKEEGALMRMALGEEATAVSYADALHPGAAGDLTAFDGVLWHDD